MDERGEQRENCAERERQHYTERERGNEGVK